MKSPLHGGFSYGERESKRAVPPVGWNPDGPADHWEARGRVANDSERATPTICGSRKGRFFSKKKIETVQWTVSKPVGVAIANERLHQKRGPKSTLNLGPFYELVKYLNLQLPEITVKMLHIIGLGKLHYQ